MDSSSESQAQDVDNVEQDEDDSAENAESVDDDVIENYGIRPTLEEKFKPLTAKEIIHNVLFDQLSTKKYDRIEGQKWSKDIANIIRNKIKELDVKKYKFVVNVVIGERVGAGVKMGTRCIWDAEADSYAHDSFTNDTLFCVAAVYAVYHY
ncbi:tctex1 domain-containing protein 2 [Copidosoma floridanum]|uniref:tctex1 domain-containing protein 2 n=1 Tax=Copidosoma floridanum TaxID=29053 RepID=UPI0006C9CEA6|nr:tctex1 domain-containing protein 2 [Copidosoma floridanum]